MTAQRARSRVLHLGRSGLLAIITIINIIVLGPLLATIFDLLNSWRHCRLLLIKLIWRHIWKMWRHHRLLRKWYAILWKILRLRKVRVLLLHRLWSLLSRDRSLLAGLFRLLYWRVTNRVNFVCSVFRCLRLAFSAPFTSLLCARCIFYRRWRVLRYNFSFRNWFAINSC